MGVDSGRERLDRLFDALSHHRRRRLFVHMSTSDEDVFTLDGLAAVLLDRADETSEGSDRDRERLKAELHHRHLPKIDGTGLIEYDPRNHHVRYRGTTCSDSVDVSRLLEIAERGTETDGLDQ